MAQRLDDEFESSVNSEGIETADGVIRTMTLFESSVNSEGIETGFDAECTASMFESSVNSEGIETHVNLSTLKAGLRAV